MSLESSWHPALMPNSLADKIRGSSKLPSESLSAPESNGHTPPSPNAWHPAFMPNAVANMNFKEPAQPSEPVSAPPSIPTPHSHPRHLSEPHIQGQGEATQDTLGEPEPVTEEDNSGHPELGNLRDALITSLASPGGVELEENPLHNGESTMEFAPGEKADFPSEGPTPPSNKHTSTMSFARTVSEEVNWGEDDEVDPEWNLQRTETDPFKLMAKSDRTNSFPQVPPTHSPAINFQLSHSEAEEILKEVEQTPRDLFGDEEGDGDDDFFTQQSDTQAEPIFHVEPSVEEKNAQQDEVGDFWQTLGRDVRQDEDQEARYEEGLPLVQPPEHPAETPIANHSVFADDGGEEDDFFNQVGQSQQPPSELSVEPPHLERKSTMQVMDSLQFQPHEQTHNTIAEEDSMASSIDKAIGGGIATSKSTILSQVLGDPESSIHNQGDFALEPESTDGDLTAKWKAALDDDEFLDDDELLPDDDEPVADKIPDPTDLFGSDDEGFLEDTEDAPADLFAREMSTPIQTPVILPNGHAAAFDASIGPTQTRRPSSSSNRPSSSGRYLPAGAQATIPPPIANPYAPSTPLFTDLSRPGPAPISAPYGAAAARDVPPPYGQPLQSQQPRPEMPKAQSFADKSKGGYSSPYDLPMEVVKPRKRVSMQQMRAPEAPIAPPRSTSMYTQPSPPARGPTSSLSPPNSSHSQQNNLQSTATPPLLQPTLPALKSKSSSFFEELPMASRPKAAPRHSSGMNPQTQSPYSPTEPPQHPPPPSGYAAPPQQHPVLPHPGHGLVGPERVSPFAPLPPTNMTIPALASRYSPAPTPGQGQTGPTPPIAQSRYSPAPPARQTMPAFPPQTNILPPILPHQPRTSSPLAHFSHDTRSSSSQSLPASFDRKSSGPYDSNLRSHHLPPTREVDEDVQELNGGQTSASYPAPGMRSSQTPPPPQGLAARMINSPPKRAVSNYLPQQASNRPAPPQGFVPPPRSQTLSPGARLEVSAAEIHQRPASVEIPPSPRVNTNIMPSVSAGRPRGFSQVVNYITPTDGREHDLMQRWRGAPVFVWGVGGSLVTSFPKDVPRYGIGQALPMIIRSPGEVKIRNIKDVDPLPERLTTFPGPLKGKSKKKDVINWLTAGIQILEQNASYLRTLSTLTHEDKRTEERILLWKLLRVFIEQEGNLEGNPIVDKAVRAVISPGLEDELSTVAPLYATGADLLGISQSSTGLRTDPVGDVAAVDQLRKHLLRGEREKAVWEAVDKRLWAHAMLLSKFSEPLSKQVAQEFVQKEVRNIGDNTESLAALYEILAGNFEESIDELVTPSARAGFQMVSTTNSAGPSKDALDGLDRWRETLGLVLSNRSSGDFQALNALGKLLSGYGRAEAAHICYLFARSYTVFDGIDNPAAAMVLVGSDHLRQPLHFDKEMEPILLSEVFEYGMSLSGTPNMTGSPHLSAYKLQHALILGEYGYREKALQYCEAIAASIYSQTRKSPYHHALLTAEVEDLTKRLKQSPKDEKSSWISKPSVDKVSSSIWSGFNKFVAGDDGDTGTPGSAAGNGTESGPFARIAGGTPTISRSPSNSEIYGSYNSNGVINGTMAQTSKTISRYAPGASINSPNDPQSAASYQSTVAYGSQPRSSLEERSSGEFRRSYEPLRRDSDYRPGSQPAPVNNHSPQMNSSYSPQASPYPPATNDNAWPHASSPYTSQQLSQGPQQPETTDYNPYPVNSLDSQQSVYAYTPLESSSYEPPSSTGYEPPSSGYAPPTYQPNSMNDEPDSPVDTRPTKKSFMDDDEDEFLGSKPAAREKTKEEKDREADEAFRNAAEADAARAKEAAPAKKSWGLGGWFSVGAKKEADMGAQPNKAIRAKLGEQSSFVYDDKLKRWVNKKPGAENTPTPTATPPPPRATGPPRTPSGTAPPSMPTSAPRGPPQRISSGMSDGPPTPDVSLPSLSAPPGAIGLGAPPAMSRSASNQSGPPTGPPSRPGTSMSNASSIDDLLGPPIPGARKGPGKGKKKGRGYVDVMGDKAT